MDSERAKTWIASLIGGGLLLILVGVIVAASAWPGTEMTFDEDVYRSSREMVESATGNETVAWLGVAMSGIGGVVLLVGLVGVGVSLGLIASRGDTPSPRKQPPAKLNRPGSGGGSQSMEDESHGSTQEVPRRAA